MRDMLSGTDNMALGTQAMLRSTTASFNMALGSGALEGNLAGQHNVASAPPRSCRARATRTLPSAATRCV